MMPDEDPFTDFRTNDDDDRGADGVKKELGNEIRVQQWRPDGETGATTEQHLIDLLMSTKPCRCREPDGCRFYSHVTSAFAANMRAAFVRCNGGRTVFSPCDPFSERAEKTNDSERNKKFYTNFTCPRFMAAVMRGRRGRDDDDDDAAAVLQCARSCRKGISSDEKRRNEWVKKMKKRFFACCCWFENDEETNDRENDESAAVTAVTVTADGDGESKDALMARASSRTEVTTNSTTAANTSNDMATTRDDERLGKMTVVSPQSHRLTDIGDKTNSPCSDKFSLTEQNNAYYCTNVTCSSMMSVSCQTEVTTSSTTANTRNDKETMCDERSEKKNNLILKGDHLTENREKKNFTNKQRTHLPYDTTLVVEQNKAYYPNAKSPFTAEAIRQHASSRLEVMSSSTMVRDTRNDTGAVSKDRPKQTRRQRSVLGPLTDDHRKRKSRKEFKALVAKINEEYYSNVTSPFMTEARAATTGHHPTT